MRLRIVLPQSFSKIGIDTLVFFFERNRQRQHFAFCQLFELFHDAIDYLRPRTTDNAFRPEARRIRQIGYLNQ